MLIIADKIQVRIGGARLEGYYMTDFRLSQENNRPNEFSFRMWKDTLQEDDTNITFSVSSKLLGKKLEFALTTIREDEGNNPVNETLEFEGIILGANSIRSGMGNGQEIKVTAYSYDCLLMDSPHCISFEKENLQSIVATVLGGCKGIKLVNQPATTSEIAYSVQYNETSYDFIKRLANRFGEWFYSNGIEVIFGKVKKEKSVTLQSGTDILSYDYQLQMKHTKFAHASHNYLDYDENKVEGSSFSGGAVAHMMTDTVYSSSESAFSKQTYHDLLGSNAEDNALDEPTAAARAQALGRKAMMTICKGRTNRADLKLGSVIIIKEAYETTPGEFSYCTHDPLLVCGIEHRASGDGFYENSFTAIPATATCPPQDDVDQYPHAIAQRAVVKDNKDPEKLGRIKVQFHWQKQQDESLTTPWLRISQPHGGTNKGFYFIPEEGEEVMVAFENGNAEKPYVSGTLYHGQAKPPNTWYNDADNIKAIRTRSGHTIEFHDTEGEEFIKIYDNEKDNYILTFSTHEKLIKLESSNNIELYARNDIIMKAGNNIDMEATKDINRKAGDNITASAGKNIKSDAGDNIESRAGKNISSTAVDDIAMSARKNLTASAAKDLSMSASDDMILGSGKEMEVNSGRCMNVSVQKSLKTNIKEDFYADVSKKYNFQANSIEQISDKTIMIKAGSKLEQKAGSGMKIDGGTKVDVKGGNLKMN